MNKDPVAVANGHQYCPEEAEQLRQVMHLVAAEIVEALIDVEPQVSYAITVVLTCISRCAAAHRSRVVMAGLHNECCTVGVIARDVVGGLDAASKKLTTACEQAHFAGRKLAVERLGIHRSTGRSLGVGDNKCLIQPPGDDVDGAQLI